MGPFPSPASSDLCVCVWWEQQGSKGLPPKVYDMVDVLKAGAM